MYNRYVPQPDGSYSRNRMPESANRQQQRSTSPPPPAPEPVHPQEHTSHRIPEHPGGFLKQLLPRDFDTGDLIVILLLLLMAGDSEEERNRAILTIALYFLM